jgi:hypothetical protein
MARGVAPVRIREASSAYVISDVVQGLNRPVVLREFGELWRARLFGREAGNRVDGLRLDLAGLVVGAAALDLHGLDSVREEQAGTDGADLQTADLTTAMPGPGGAGMRRSCSVPDRCSL